MTWQEGSSLRRESAEARLGVPVKSPFRSTRFVFATLVVVSLGLVAALSPIATATPPGQGPCSHGNSDKACRPDPQQTHGQDCAPHGGSGGVDEDHCPGSETTTSADPTTTASSTTEPITPPSPTTTTTSPPTTKTAGAAPSSTTVQPDSTPGGTSSPVEITPTDATPTDSPTSTTQTATVEPRRHGVAGSTKEKSHPATTRKAAPKRVKASSVELKAKPKAKPKTKKAAKKRGAVQRHKPHVNKPRIRKVGVLPFTP
jgi:hypothetical protein